MALQVITSFGNIAPGQLWTPTFVQELFENAAYSVVGSVSGSTILSAGSVLNTHLADDSVDARTWKDTENAFVCAGLQINGPLVLAGGTGNLTVAGLSSFAGVVAILGNVSLGTSLANNIYVEGQPLNLFAHMNAAASLAGTDLMGVETGGGAALKKATVNQVQAATRSKLVIAEDQTGGQALAALGWINHNITHLSTNEVTGASLAASVITLPAGRYLVRIFSAHNDSSKNLIRLATVAGTTLVMGISKGGNSTLDNYAPGSAELEGVFTLATSDQVRIQQYSGSGGSTGTTIAAAGGTQYVMRATFENWAA